VDDGQLRLDQGAEDVGADELRFLGAVVVGLHDDVDSPGERFGGRGPEVDLDAGDALHECFGRYGIDDQVAEEVLHAADALGHFDEPGAEAFADDGLPGGAAGVGALGEALEPPRLAAVGQIQRLDGLDGHIHPRQRAFDEGVVQSAVGEELRQAELVDVPEPAVDLGVQLAPRLAADRQRDVVGAERIEPAGVDPETIAQVLFRKGELLDEVADVRLAGVQAEMLAQPAPGADGDSGDLRGPEIVRHAVGLGMVQRRQESLAAGHGEPNVSTGGAEVNPRGRPAASAAGAWTARG